jgi:phosphomethylpyrimidine synthase
MKISQDVRDYAAKLNEQDQGMVEMRDKFREMGSNVYIDSSNKPTDPA